MNRQTIAGRWYAGGLADGLLAIAEPLLRAHDGRRLLRSSNERGPQPVAVRISLDSATLWP